MNRKRRQALQWGLLLAASCGRGLALASSKGEGGAVEIETLSLRREEGAVLLDFALKVQLPAVAEEALKRGLPLYFFSQVALFRPRWYWRDERVARVERQWRISFQPLTGQYRVSVGAFGQQHSLLQDALATVSRLTRWEVAEAGKAEAERHYAEFVWRLDTAQLPRPFQLGLGGSSEWALGVERSVRLEP